MKALPFLKGILGMPLVLLGVPIEHLLVILDAHTLTISRNDTGGVVQ